MTDRQLIGLFVGVPDEMLRAVGLIVVLCSRLDLLRMQLLEVGDLVSVTKSAQQRRWQVTKALEDAFAAAPFDQMQSRVSPWLQESNALFDFRDELVHSTGGYQVRGDGSSRFVREHPRVSKVQKQFTAEVLDSVVLRLVDASHDGAILRMDAMLLNDHGPVAYADHVKRREELAVEQKEALEEALREAQPGE